MSSARERALACEGWGADLTLLFNPCAPIRLGSTAPPRQSRERAVRLGLDRAACGAPCGLPPSSIAMRPTDVCQTNSPPTSTRAPSAPGFTRSSRFFARPRGLTRVGRDATSFRPSLRARRPESFTRKRGRRLRDQGDLAFSRRQARFGGPCSAGRKVFSSLRGRHDRASDTSVATRS